MHGQAACDRGERYTHHDISKPESGGIRNYRYVATRRRYQRRYKCQRSAVHRHVRAAHGGRTLGAHVWNRRHQQLHPRLPLGKSAECPLNALPSRALAGGVNAGYIPKKALSGVGLRN